MPERRGSYENSPAEEAPPVGLAAIAAEFAAGVTTARPSTPGGHAPPGADTLWVDGLPSVWPLRLPPLSVQAAGTSDPVDWGPPAGSGRAWRIREVVITFGTGASQVTIYKEAIQPVNLRFQTNTQGLWEPSMLILLPGERLVAVITGGGAIIAIEGEQIAAAFLPRYLA